MSRYSLFALICCVGIIVFAATIGCPPAPTGGDGDGNDTACGDQGAGCEGDGDCCDGLTCQDFSCEPATDGPDGDDDDGGDGGDDDGDDVEPPAEGLLVDHTSATAYDDIPAWAIEDAKANFNIFYGHTSHGSQLVTGMNMLDTGAGTLSIEENDGVDLGHEGDLGWVDTTRDVLDQAGSEINMVIWSWCAGVSDNTEAGINAYLEAMNGLEDEYPDIVFVYMTGHLDGSGPDGNLYVRNDQIRDYCNANDKILFDFADIESYDPDGNYYPDGSDWCEWCETWCDENTCPDLDCVNDSDCAHSVCFNCYQKGRAFWWMMARIAGWSGSADDVTPPDDGGGTDDGGTTDGGDSSAEGGVPAERLEPADLTYQGAFRLPEDFNWGALGMSFYPGGDSGTGSLLVTGFELLSDPAHPGETCWDPSWDCYASYGEVSIPTPAVEANWEDLPGATLVTPLTNFDGGLASSVHREYLFVSDLEYVPQQGSQTGDKLYGSINLWYAEGVAGADTFPTVWMANMDGSGAQGMFHVGPEGTSPYHGRKTGSYLFTAPEWYADEYLGGRTLITGRSRGTPGDTFEEISIDAGSQGPTFFAFHPWESDTSTGDLDALPVLYYRVSFPGCAGPNVGDPEECDYPDFTMCDDWTGGAFVDNGTQRAIMLVGYKGLGDNCYDEPPVECSDPCSASHGYHCQPYERQVIFYDVHELGHSALENQDPWIVVPYEVWRPDEFYLSDSPCYNAGGMTFDEDSGRIFIVERGLGAGEENAVVVHVWSL
ncbi:MAG: hypothetical protein JSU63_17450 [Phycisphaerales bacterium]|nr:MAG: hypothetical protein JSU63_17450 [Phycisphaerales bacterium]